MREIAREALKHHPHHVECLSNLAVAYLVFGKYDKALPNLLLAEKSNPQYYIVLGNIAYAYREL